MVDVTNRGWHHTPATTVALTPYFDWPPSLRSWLAWLRRSWIVVSARTLILLLAAATWFFAQPDIERAVSFRFGWIAEMYFRNLGLMLVVAGGLHLWLYRFKKQGDLERFDDRDKSISKRYTFGSQVRDNMFWSLASGVTIWTAFEVATFWGYANGYVPYLHWSEHPVWFVVLFLLQPIWGSFHFYWIHRMLHWTPLYRRAHSLHHRNVNVGPWSGLSMHPVEHVLYLSTVMIHWVVASHPIHLLFHSQVKALEAATSHAGYQRLHLGEKVKVDLGDFFHQLHHRYFECNYGTQEMPWDRWFGTFHSGTEADAMRMRERRAQMRR